MPKSCAAFCRFTAGKVKQELAEREGFEPPIPVKVYTLSRRAPSATRPSLRAASCRVHLIRGRLLASNLPRPFHWAEPGSISHPTPGIRFVTWCIHPCRFRVCNLGVDV